MDITCTFLTTQHAYQSVFSIDRLTLNVPYKCHYTCRCCIATVNSETGTYQFLDGLRRQPIMNKAFIDIRLPRPRGLATSRARGALYTCTLQCRVPASSYGPLRHKSQTPLIRFVEDLLYNKLYNKSTTNPQQIHNKSKCCTTSPQQVHNK